MKQLILTIEAGAVASPKPLFKKSLDVNEGTVIPYEAIRKSLEFMFSSIDLQVSFSFRRY